MQSLGNDERGNSAATMRVLVADQEPEMLEAIARVFEVDVATTKATCIDLLRANHFDVIVACERLGDGSGLELLSHIGQRWPHVIRILAIEPERRAMLRGRLAPFKLFETLSYPIDEQKLEAALERAAEQIAANEAAEARNPPPVSAGDRPGTTPPTARLAQSTVARPSPVGVVANSPARSGNAGRSFSSAAGSTNAARPLNAAAGSNGAPRALKSTAGLNSAARPLNTASGPSNAARPLNTAARPSNPARPLNTAAGPSNPARPLNNTAAAPSNPARPLNTAAAPSNPARPLNTAARPSNPARPLNMATGPSSAARSVTNAAGAADAARAVADADRSRYASRSMLAPPKDDARRPGGRTSSTSSAPTPRTGALSSSQAAASLAANPRPETGYPPLPSKGSKIVPLGSPAAGDYKILPHNYDQTMPGTLRSAREDHDSKKPSLPEKAASLAAEALSKVSRYIKPQSSDADDLDPPPPRRKR